MHVGVGDGHPLASVRDIEQTVVIVLVMRQIGGQVAVVNPHVGRLLDANGVTVLGYDLADLQVAHDDVRLVLNIEANASNGFSEISRSSSNAPNAENGGDIQLPAAPTIDLLEPTRTWADPEIAPLTITIPAEVPETAASSSDSEVTVVVVPPAPPLVLDRM